MDNGIYSFYFEGEKLRKVNTSKGGGRLKSQYYYDDDDNSADEKQLKDWERKYPYRSEMYAQLRMAKELSRRFANRNETQN